MIICTSICANYLPKAMTLAASVKEHIPDAFFVLCLLEKDIPPQIKSFPHFDAVVLAKDLGWENFDCFIFRHTIVEASTAVKGQLFRYLFDKYTDEEKFVYLDPDIRVYSDFIELRALLDQHSIIVAPHLLKPGNIDMEISSLAHGCYNLGFLALSRSDNARAFADWWADRLFSYCYDDKARGLFTDQRWVDLAPCFFDVHVLKHHGYDFATWSLFGCHLEQAEDGAVTVNGDPLRFIHFSGLDSGTVGWAIDEWLHDPRGKEIFGALYKQYLTEHSQNDEKQFSKIPWTYATYTDGMPVSKQARYICREKVAELTANPFDLGEEHFLGMHREIALASLLDKVKKAPAYMRQHGVKATLKKVKQHLPAVFAGCAQRMRPKSIPDSETRRTE